MNINLDTTLIDIANTSIIAIHPKDHIKDAEAIFKRINRKILPVVDKGELKGILFMRDFQNISKTTQYIVKFYGREFQFEEMKVEDYMTDKFYALKPNLKIIDAIRFFNSERQYYIPLVENKQLKGLVTPFDVFQYIINQNEINT